MLKVNQNLCLEGNKGFKAAKYQEVKAIVGYFFKP